MKELALSLFKIKNLKLTRGFFLLLSSIMFLTFSLGATAANTSSNKTDKPTIIRIEEGAKTIKLAGVPGATVEATFKNGSKATATVSVAKATSLTVPEGVTNNLEAVQIGMYTGSGSAWETVPSNSILENNYFYKWDGEIEIVSVKAHNVIIRYNTIEESVGTICLRISDNSQVYGNYFFQNNYPDSGGIRAYGSGHLIYNNYIEAPAYNGQQRSGIVLQAGAGADIIDSKTDVRVASNIIVANNTIVSGSGIGMTFGAEPSATKPYAPKNITLVNNVIINSEDKKTIMNILSPTESIIKNNFIAPLNPEAPISGSNSLEKPIPSDFEFINKEIFYTVVNNTSIPTLKSPVIGNGNVNGVDLSFLKTDIEGKKRGSKIDAGAHQLNGTGPVTNKRLTLKDVGPISKK